MDIFKRLFAKAETRGLFSGVSGNTPTSLLKLGFLTANKGWVYACVKRNIDAHTKNRLAVHHKQEEP